MPPCIKIRKEGIYESRGYSDNRGKVGTNFPQFHARESDCSELSGSVPLCNSVIEYGDLVYGHVRHRVTDTPGSQSRLAKPCKGHPVGPEGGVIVYHHRRKVFRPAVDIRWVFDGAWTGRRAQCFRTQQPGDRCRGPTNVDRNVSLIVALTVSNNACRRGIENDDGDAVGSKWSWAS